MVHLTNRGLHITIISTNDPACTPPTAVTSRITRGPHTVAGAGLSTPAGYAFLGAACTGTGTRGAGGDAGAVERGFELVDVVVVLNCDGNL